MTKQEFEEALKMGYIKPGCYTSLIWTSEPPVRAAKKGEFQVTKFTQGVGRLGVDYRHLREIVQSGVETGPLPAGEWVEGREKLLIKHKDNYQVRITTTKNPNHKAKVTYLLNGEVIDEDELKAKDIVLPSYWSRRKQDLLVFNVKLKNLLKINDYVSDHAFN